MRSLLVIIALAAALVAQNPSDEHHIPPTVPKATAQTVGNLKMETPHTNLAPGAAPDISQGVPITFTYTGATDGAQFYWNFGDMPVWLQGTAVNTHLFKRAGTFLVRVVVIKDGKQTNEQNKVRITAPVEFPSE